MAAIIHNITKKSKNFFNFITPKKKKNKKKKKKKKKKKNK
jgi:hypothetical protein